MHVAPFRVAYGAVKEVDERDIFFQQAERLCCLRWPDGPTYRLQFCLWYRFTSLDQPRFANVQVVSQLRRGLYGARHRLPSVLGRHSAELALYAEFDAAETIFFALTGKEILI